MLLNARQNGFLVLFPEDFFSSTVKEKYAKYFKSLIMPYDTIEEFVTSTVQTIDFPGWNMTIANQNRPNSKIQPFKNAKPIPDLFDRSITITFKLTDAYLNYFIFLDQAFEFLDFKNPDQTFSPIRLVMLDNQGYAVSSVIFRNPILKSQDGLKLSYSSANPDFKTFSVKFEYYYFDIEIDVD